MIDFKKNSCWLTLTDSNPDIDIVCWFSWAFCCKYAAYLSDSLVFTTESCGRGCNHRLYESLVTTTDHCHYIVIGNTSILWLKIHRLVNASRWRYFQRVRAQRLAFIDMACIWYICSIVKFASVMIDAAFSLWYFLL